MASSGTDHHHGADENPSWSGNVANSHSWVTSTRRRKPYATAATGTPIKAPNSSSAT